MNAILTCFRVLLFGLACSAVCHAELLGHISEDTEKQPETSQPAGPGQSRLLYRVSCSPEAEKSEDCNPEAVEDVMEINSAAKPAPTEESRPEPVLAAASGGSADGSAKDEGESHKSGGKHKHVKKHHNKHHKKAAKKSKK